MADCAGISSGYPSIRTQIETVEGSASMAQPGYGIKTIRWIANSTAGTHKAERPPICPKMVVCCARRLVYCDEPDSSFSWQHVEDRETDSAHRVGLRIRRPWERCRVLRDILDVRCARQVPDGYGEKRSSTASRSRSGGNRPCSRMKSWNSRWLKSSPSKTSSSVRSRIRFI